MLKAATALGLVLSTVVGVPVARAQLAPPPFVPSETPAVPAPPPPAPRAPAPPPVAPARPPEPVQPPAPPVARPQPPPVAAPPLAAPVTPARPPQPVQPPPAPPAARTQSPADDDAIDDPKVSRRLGTRITVPPAPRPSAPAAPVPAPTPPAAPRPATVAAPAPRPVPTTAPASASRPKPVVVATPVAPLAPARPVSDEGEAGGVPAIERSYTPPAEDRFQPELPRLKLSLRRFDFVQLGASTTPNGVASSETFNAFSVDVYPVSRTVRIGLTSAFGWQSGKWLADGDYFATQTVSLGLQYRDLGRVVPFAEGFTGVGYMRRLQFERSIPTAFWQFGADAGVEVYVARTGYLSFALGYLRPINGFAKRQMFTSVFVDTWSFKVGVGI
ncbi:MAG TPA: hypothetical protein VN903_02660 [Polyangia bacterium]|nr:hypothetical protein [Polyangia bacterium]